MKKPLVLCILDGYGYRKNSKHNAVAAAKTPVLDSLFSKYQKTFLHCSGMYVGLPEGQMGNSEVGHTAIGTGRVVYQSLPRISMSIEKNELKDIKEIVDTINLLKQTGGKCHLWGLLSDGGIHSHIEHLIALIKIFEDNQIDVCVHACLDGRDVPPKSAMLYLQQLSERMGAAQISTVCGRYYAMDRDKRWDRTEQAFNIITHPMVFTKSATQYVEESYAKDILDEFIQPIAIEGYNGVMKGDVFFAFNYRTDRVRQMLASIIFDDFSGFYREYGKPKFEKVLGMTEYASDFNGLVDVVFKKEEMLNSLGEVISKAGFTQLRAAETEKYPHVTFFFNGGNENVFDGEERILVPSPQVATYDLSPQMSAKKLTDIVVEKINNNEFDVYVINFANPDMVGHTGVFDAVVKSIEVVDDCVYQLQEAVLRKNGCLLITADHGNAEEMYDDEADQPFTSHTTNDVVFCVVSDDYINTPLKQCVGSLQDIAPTILDILQLDAPSDMTGKSLFR